MSGTLLFGGTFDPVHHGHLITAQAALEALGAERCLLIPAALSPHKLTRQSAPAADRLAMLRLAIAGQAAFAVEDFELAREGPSYTVDTVAALRARQPGERWTLLMGADQLPLLHTWHRASELLEQTEVALLARPGFPLEAGLAAAERAFSPAVAERLRRAVVRAPQIDISATVIRQRVAQGASIRYLAPEAVVDYIASHGLYRHPASPAEGR